MCSEHSNIRTFEHSNISLYLERQGWTRQIAGDADFNAAVHAIDEMFRTGRGLLVSGEYGVGKTALAAAVTKAFSPVFKVRLALPSDREHLLRDWQEYWAINPYTQNVWLDDLGAEPFVNEYGVKTEAAGDFIVTWHELAAKNVRLIVTTNLSANELDARYGGRVFSRLKDLCIPLRLTGTDKRQWTLGTAKGTRNP